MMPRRLLAPWRRRRIEAAEARRTLLLMRMAVNAAIAGEPVVFINAAHRRRDLVEATQKTVPGAATGVGAAVTPLSRFGL